MSSATSIKSYVVDRDTSLVAAGAVTGRLVVSTDPTLLESNISTAPSASASVATDILIYRNSAAFDPTQMKIPLPSGRTIYLANQSASWAFLLFDDTISVETLVT
jgi:hypothetical protein